MGAAPHWDCSLQSRGRDRRTLELPLALVLSLEVAPSLVLAFPLDLALVLPGDRVVDPGLKVTLAS